jgi:hypothetical protein
MGSAFDRLNRAAGRDGRRPALPAGRPSAADPCTAPEEGARGGTRGSPTLGAGVGDTVPR